MHELDLSIGRNYALAGVLEDANLAAGSVGDFAGELKWACTSGALTGGRLKRDGGAEVPTIVNSAFEGDAMFVRDWRV